MPWKERSVVEECILFVLRLKDRESMASLCREFGISRVTGYKISERYKECGLEGLTDRARMPYRYAMEKERPSGRQNLSLGNFPAWLRHLCNESAYELFLRRTFDSNSALNSDSSCRIARSGSFRHQSRLE